MPTTVRRRRARKDSALDDYDYAIVKLLQDDCHLNHTAISKALAGMGLKLSSGTVSDRIERLLRDGYIKTMTAIVDYEKFGVGTAAILFVTLRDKNAENQKAFVQAALALPQIVEIHELLGETDYVVKVRVHDIRSAQETATKLAVGTADVKTLPITVSHRETTALESFGARFLPKTTT